MGLNCATCRVYRTVWKNYEPLFDGLFQKKKAERDNDLPSRDKRGKKGSCTNIKRGRGKTPVKDRKKGRKGPTESEEKIRKIKRKRIVPLLPLPN